MLRLALANSALSCHSISRQDIQPLPQPGLVFVVHLALVHVRIAVVTGIVQGLAYELRRCRDQRKQHTAHLQQSGVLSGKRAVGVFEICKSGTHW